MSERGSRKRVKFSLEDVERAMQPKERQLDTRETLLPGPDEDELPLSSGQQKDEAGDALDLSLGADLALADDEPAADDETERRFTEDGIPIEPFNLRSERSEGFFDADGNFVAYRGGDDTDAWLETLPAPGDEAFATAGPSISASAHVRRQNDDQRPEMTQRDKEDYRLRIVQTLRHGETVLEALRRLGTSEGPDGLGRRDATEATPPSHAERLAAVRTKLAGRVPERNRASFIRITEDASQLLNAGDTEIYSATREQLVRGLQRAQGRNPAETHYTAVDAAPAHARLAEEASRLTQQLTEGLRPAATEAEEAGPPAGAAAADPDTDMFAGDASTEGAPRLASGATSDPELSTPPQPEERLAPGFDQAQGDLGGFVYDEDSRMYYNTALGCFFDAERQLYGDAASGRWYAFNDGKYELASCP